MFYIAIYIQGTSNMDLLVVPLVVWWKQIHHVLTHPLALLGLVLGWSQKVSEEQVEGSWLLVQLGENMVHPYRSSTKMASSFPFLTQ